MHVGCAHHAAQHVEHLGHALNHRVAPPDDACMRGAARRESTAQLRPSEGPQAEGGKLYVHSFHPHSSRTFSQLFAPSQLLCSSDKAVRLSYCGGSFVWPAQPASRAGSLTVAVKDEAVHLVDQLPPLRHGRLLGCRREAGRGGAGGARRDPGNCRSAPGGVVYAPPCAPCCRAYKGTRCRGAAPATVFTKAEVSAPACPPRKTTTPRWRWRRGFAAPSALVQAAPIRARQLPQLPPPLTQAAVLLRLRHGSAPRRPALLPQLAVLPGAAEKPPITPLRSCRSWLWEGGLPAPRLQERLGQGGHRGWRGDRRQCAGKGGAFVVCQVLVLRVLRVRWANRPSSSIST